MSEGVGRFFAKGDSRLHLFRARLAEPALRIRRQPSVHHSDVGRHHLSPSPSASRSTPCLAHSPYVSRASWAWSRCCPCASGSVTGAPWMHLFRAGNEPVSASTLTCGLRERWTYPIPCSSASHRAERFPSSCRRTPLRWPACRLRTGCCRQCAGWRMGLGTALRACLYG